MTRMGANAMLLLAAVIWGSGNVAQKLALSEIAPFTTLASRGVLGLVTISPWLIRECQKSGGVPPNGWLDLLGTGSAFAVALALQQAAALHSTVANLSFLLNATIIFTPLLGWLCHRRRPAAQSWIAVCTAISGVWLMSGSPGSLQKGDMLSLLAAFAYSVWIILMGRLAHSMDRPFLIAGCQFFLVAMLGAAASVVEPTPSISSMMSAGPEILFLGVLSTGLAFTLQAMAQRQTSATEATLVMSLESVFGAATAAAILGDGMTAASGFGAGLILAAVMINEFGAHTPNYV